MPNRTAREIIELRNKLWDETHNLDVDTDFRYKAALYFAECKPLRDEIRANPEKLIEIFFVVVDKHQQTIPFFFNDAQQKFVEHLNWALKECAMGMRSHLKFMLLKGRQQGFTTLITAYQLASSMMKANFSGMTLADNTENTEAIFSDKAKYPYEQMPQSMKPSERYNNRRELHFQTKDGKGLNSRWRVATAGSKEVGRSKTLNFFHASEAAFFNDLIGTLTGLSAALTGNCIAILETTANGYNSYKELWDSGSNWECLFFEWWLTREYELPFKTPIEEQTFKERVNSSGDCDDPDDEKWAYMRCKWLREAKGLKWEQINWYFDKWRDYKGMIRQEYPCTPDDAFISSGRNYFSIEKAGCRLSEVQESLKRFQPRRGYFEYKYLFHEETETKRIDHESIRWVEHSTGYIVLYRDPVQKLGYTIGADTASDGSDKSIGQCIQPDGTQVAVLTIDKDEDLFADQLYCLGKMYNWALIAPEVNHSTHPTKVLVERNYPNLYVRGSSPDSISGRLHSKYGFNTNRGNRMAMLGDMRTLVREKAEVFNDPETLKEMLCFVVDDNGKPTAEEGKHDDYIMAYAIAFYTRTQQSSDIKPEASELKGWYTEDELEDLGYSKYEIKRYLADQRGF